MIIAAAVAQLCLASATAVEMPYVEPELRDRPPVAAPTSRIAVEPITTVRSQSEKIGDFSSGLIQGLLSRSEGVRGIAFIAVESDHVIVQSNFGATRPDTAFELGSMTDLLAAIAAMREAERGALALDADIATVLGEENPRNLTAAQILTHQGGDFAMLVQVVEKASGQPLPAYLQANIFAPLAINAATGEGPLRLDAPSLGRLMIALVNGGAYANVPILQPATVELMQRTHVTAHPAVPGWSYGFAEMRRNNWRALQRDGVSARSQLRLVVVPEARIAYLIAVDGEADTQFWRTLDSALFDTAFPPQAASAGLGGAPPTLDEARAAAGSYEERGSYAAEVAQLLNPSRRLSVRAGSDGALAVSGAQDAVLIPQAGGYWASADGNVVAALREGSLAIGTAVFAPLALWKRPLFYALLALLAAIAGGGIAYYEFFVSKRPWRLESATVLAPAGVTAAFVMFSLIAWLVALAA